MSIRIIGLCFPKVRVNFNGQRLKTKDRDNNWSNFYQVNENKDQVKGIIIEMRYGNIIKVLNFTDLNKEYFIGNSEDCSIRLNELKYGSVIGKIKFFPDMGWIIKNERRGENSKLNKYGIFLGQCDLAMTRNTLSEMGNVEQMVPLFKQYKNMKLVLGGHYFRIDNLE